MSSQQVAERYYALIAGGDAEAVDAFVLESFAEDAFVHRPESLPGGGRRNGRERVRKFSRSAAANAGGPGSLVVTTVAAQGGDGNGSVVVELSFQVGSTPSRALEWWTFADGKATGIQAFYWDTAALLNQPVGVGAEEVA